MVNPTLPVDWLLPPPDVAPPPKSMYVMVQKWGQAWAFDSSEHVQELWHVLPEAGASEKEINDLFKKGLCSRPFPSRALDAWIALDPDVSQRFSALSDWGIHRLDVDWPVFLSWVDTQPKIERKEYEKFLSRLVGHAFNLVHHDEGSPDHQKLAVEFISHATTNPFLRSLVVTHGRELPAVLMAAALHEAGDISLLGCVPGRRLKEYVKSALGSEKVSRLIWGVGVSKEKLPSLWKHWESALLSEPMRSAWNEVVNEDASAILIAKSWISRWLPRGQYEQSPLSAWVQDPSSAPSPLSKDLFGSGYAAYANNLPLSVQASAIEKAFSGAGDLTLIFQALHRLPGVLQIELNAFLR